MYEENNLMCDSVLDFEVISSNDKVDFIKRVAIPKLNDNIEIANQIIAIKNLPEKDVEYGILLRELAELNIEIYSMILSHNIQKKVNLSFSELLVKRMSIYENIEKYRINYSQ